MLENAGLRTLQNHKLKITTTDNLNFYIKTLNKIIFVSIVTFLSVQLVKKL